jgi:hypothetical protein
MPIVRKRDEPRRQRSAADAAQDRERGELRHELTDQSHPRCAEGATNAELCTARGQRDGQQLIYSAPPRE